MPISNIRECWVPIYTRFMSSNVGQGSERRILHKKNMPNLGHGMCWSRCGRAQGEGDWPGGICNKSENFRHVQSTLICTINIHSRFWLIRFSRLFLGSDSHSTSFHHHHFTPRPPPPPSLVSVSDNTVVTYEFVAGAARLAFTPLTARPTHTL